MLNLYVDKLSLSIENALSKEIKVVVFFLTYCARCFFFNPMERRRSPVLQNRNPARFSVIPGKSNGNPGEGVLAVTIETRLDRGPGGLGLGVPT